MASRIGNFFGMVAIPISMYTATFRIMTSTLTSCIRMTTAPESYIYLIWLSFALDGEAFKRSSSCTEKEVLLSLTRGAPKNLSL